MSTKFKTPIVATKVRIISCGRTSWWYANYIGREFNVRLGGRSLDHIIWEDYWSRVEIKRHIAQADCVIVPKLK